MRERESLFILLQHLRTCRFRLIYVQKQNKMKKRKQKKIAKLFFYFLVRVVAILLISTVRCHLTMLEDEPRVVLVINDKQHVTMYVCVCDRERERKREYQKEMKNEKWC